MSGILEALWRTRSQEPVVRNVSFSDDPEDLFLEGNRFRPSQLEMRVYGHRLPERPGETNRAQRIPQKELDRISEEKFLEAAGDLMGIAGSILNTVPAMARDAIAGKNPLPGVFRPELRTTGRDLAEQWGWVGPNEDRGWMPDRGDLVGGGLELATDLGTGLAAKLIGRISGNVVKAGASAMRPKEAFGGFDKDRINDMLKVRRQMTVVKGVKGLGSSSSAENVEDRLEQMFAHLRDPPSTSHKVSGRLTERQAKVLPEIISEIHLGKIDGAAQRFANDPPLIVSGTMPGTARHELLHGYHSFGDATEFPNLPLATRVIGKAIKSNNPHIRGVGLIADEILAHKAGGKQGGHTVRDLLLNVHDNDAYARHFANKGVPGYQRMVFQLPSKVKQAVSKNPLSLPAGIFGGSAVMTYPQTPLDLLSDLVSGFQQEGIVEPVQ